MSEPSARERIAVVFSPDAGADIRGISREVAMGILDCLDRQSSRTGDVKKLKPPLTGFRLRCGDYRLFFDSTDDHTINVTAVRHRREAYRQRGGKALNGAGLGYLLQIGTQRFRAGLITFFLRQEIARSISNLFS